MCAFALLVEGWNLLVWCDNLQAQAVSLEGKALAFIFSKLQSWWLEWQRHHRFHHLGWFTRGWCLPRLLLLPGVSTESFYPERPVANSNWPGWRTRLFSFWCRGRLGKQLSTCHATGPSRGPGRSLWSRECLSFERRHVEPSAEHPHKGWCLGFAFFLVFDFLTAEIVRSPSLHSCSFVQVLSLF